MAPHPIITDQDLALMNALQRVPYFIHSFNILCIWHVNKNIAKNCKIGIEQEEWDTMMKKLNSVWQSPTKELFDSNWEAFRQDNPLTVIRKVSRFSLSEVQKQEDLLKNRRTRK